MPATRKARTSTPNGPAAKGSQKTLAFSNSKISKPSQPSSDKKAFTPPPTSILEKAVDALPPPTKVVVAQKPAQKPQQSEDEVRALKVSDAQIKKYWKAREAERMAARVHQEGLSVEEKVLRLFDMSSQFGVCLPFRFYFGLWVLISVMWVALHRQIP